MLCVLFLLYCFMCCWVVEEGGDGELLYLCVECVFELLEDVVGVFYVGGLCVVGVVELYECCVVCFFLGQFVVYGVDCGFLCYVDDYV